MSYILFHNITVWKRKRSTNRSRRNPIEVLVQSHLHALLASCMTFMVFIVHFCVSRWTQPMMLLKTQHMMHPWVALTCLPGQLLCLLSQGKILFALHEKGNLDRWVMLVHYHHFHSSAMFTCLQPSACRNLYMNCNLLCSVLEIWPWRIKK